METRLATASWANAAVVAEKYCFKAGRFWLGRSATGETLGYNDDRHVCLVAGTRGGKGTSQIVNNLAWWPGSAVIVDPKGENAPLTSARRGFGAAHIDGMGQFVQVLDPFNECAKVVDPRYRAQFNPFDAIDPKSEDAIDEAGLLADALIVIREGGETSWDEMARSLVRGLILHILTSPDYVGMRNFTTLRELIMRGEWVGVQVLEEENARRFQSQIMLSRLGKTGWDEKTASFIAEPVATDFDPVPVPSPYKLLFDLMKANPRCDGVIAGVGAMFGEMVATAPKQFMGVLQSAMRNTEFADSPGMKRVTEKSTFKLSELKTRREGMTVYLTLPSRYRRTHFRWLRMMLTLTINEMQKTKGKPACGHPVLFCLDEFAGLKRMEDIENAAAEIAGYGVKLYFVLQTLEQLKNVYKDNWETFLANAGLKVFFSIEDQFTRKYVSELAGEAEVIRQVRSSSLGTNVQENWNTGRSWGSSGGTSETINRNWSHGRGASGSTNWSHTDGKSRGTSGGGSFATTESTSVSFGPGGLFGSDVYKGSSGGTSISNSVNSGWNESENSSDTYGGNSGWTVNLSLGGGDAVGTTRTWTEGGNTSQGGGVGQSQTVTVSETVHVRPLLRPDEVARIFGRIDEKDSPHYPGLALVMVAGKAPFIVRRVNYYEDVGFLRCFDKHPDHPFPVPSSWFQQLDVESFLYLEKSGANRDSGISWFVKPGETMRAGEVVAEMRIGGAKLNLYAPMDSIVTEADEGNFEEKNGKFTAFRFISVPGAKQKINACPDLWPACAGRREQKIAKLKDSIGSIMSALIVAIFFAVAGMIVIAGLRENGLAWYVPVILLAIAAFAFVAGLSGWIDAKRDFQAEWEYRKLFKDMKAKPAETVIEWAFEILDRWATAARREMIEMRERAKEMKRRMG